jgi:hypothetical protein
MVDETKRQAVQQQAVSMIDSKCREVLVERKV